METVRTYQQTLDKVYSNPGILALVAEYRKDVQAMITRGMSLRWEFFVNAFDTRQQMAALLPPGQIGAPGAINDFTAREGRHGAFVRELASTVSMFQDRTDALLDLYSDVSKILDSLATCASSQQAFEALLLKMQKIIDQLNLEGYANLDNWVKDLDTKIGSFGEAGEDH
jgi:dynein heavy chain 1